MDPKSTKAKAIGIYKLQTVVVLFSQLFLLRCTRNLAAGDQDNKLLKFILMENENDTHIYIRN